MSKVETILHIGHPKTGTSAIQSFLAKNADLLDKYGIEYPEDQSFERARAGQATNGNARSFTMWSARRCDRVLFSSESFFGKFARDDETFHQKLSSIDGEKTIVCFTRDLFDLFRSAYGQLVKAGKFSGPISDYVDVFVHKRNIYRALVQVIEGVRSLGYNLVLRNYSRVDRDIVPSFVNILLGDAARSFMNEAILLEHSVNRSLTRTELEIQRLFTEYCQVPTSDVVARALVDQLPNIRAEKIPIPLESQKRLAEATAAHIAFINKHLAKEEAIRCDINPEAGEDGNGKTCELTFDQLRVLIKGVAAKMNDLHLWPSDHKILENIAMKYQTQEPLAFEEAAALIKMREAIVNDRDLREKFTRWNRERIRVRKRG